MVVVGDRFEKNVRLVDREFQRRGKELQKKRSENLNLEVRGLWERQRWLEEQVLPVVLILMSLRGLF